MYRNLVCLTLSVCLVTACGGGGGGDSTNTPAPLPVSSINAGSDQAAAEKSVITLAGQATPSGGEFVWSQVSGPLLSNFPLTGATQSVTLPSVKLTTQLVFDLKYTTPAKEILMDSVTVTVNSVNQLPIVSIKQTAPAQLPSKYNDTIILSSDGSKDPDTDGVIVGYKWLQTAGEPLEITDLTNKDLTFTHPLLEQDSQVQFSLTITDDEGGKSTNYHDLILRKTTQVIAADAGDAQTVREFATVNLDASASKALTDSYSCYWQQVSGTLVNLIDAEQCQSRFIVPDIDIAEQLIFEVTITDDNSRTATAQTQINLQPLPLGLNNDSGMNKCYSNSAAISCGNADFPGQDAELGRDVVADYLDKVGAGRLAFDFTKLDEFADELPDTATNFSCVRDNVTGLIWEVKQANIGIIPNTQLREGQNSYSWFYTGEGNGGVPGFAAAAKSSCPSDVDCGIETYVAQVNAANFCGANNWRIPSYNELMGLMDLAKQGNGPLIDTEYFPNLPNSNTLGHLRYWTKETSADGQSLNFAWILDFQTGNDLAYPKTSTAYLRLVRTP